MIFMALIAGCACILGSYHLGYCEGIRQAAETIEENINMALDCIGECRDAAGKIC